MTPAETAAQLLTARRALTAAESAHAEAIAAEVRASVPGPWVGLAEVGAVIEQGPIRVGVDWSNYGGHDWTAWACGMPRDEMWHRRSDLAASPREALESLRARLNRAKGDEGRAALALVVRLLRGWMTALRWTTVEGDHVLTDGHVEVARLVPAGDCWRPYANGRRCTLADDLPAAVAIVRAVLRVDVPGLP